jgi:hypothetical protein
VPNDSRSTHEIGSEILALSEVAGKEAGRYAIDSIWYDGETAVATDGRMLVCMQGRHATRGKPVMIPAKLARQARIPKVKKFKLPAYPEKTRVRMQGRKAVVRSESRVWVGQPEAENSGLYPKWREMVPDMAHYELVGHLNAQLLGKMAAAILAAGGPNDDRARHVAVYKPHDQNSPFVFRAKTDTGRGVVAVLAPMKCDRWPAERTPWEDGLRNA